MIVMPNSNCVDFKSAAAWGKVNGDSTYLQAKYASKPAVHVHEFGHNLGMQHSGQWSNGELNPYGDQSGYMGGNTGMAWDDEGAHMCFNAAKMYYSNWYSDQQKIVYPANGAFSTKLVALDDIRTDKDNTDASIVLATTGASGSRVFLMYNKAKGMTADVGDKDTVTIIRQSGSSAKSEQVGALKTNDEKKINNWSGGNTLVIKNCGTSFSNGVDTALVIMYVEGVNLISCDGPTPQQPNPVPSPAPVVAVPLPSQCTDVPDWRDSYGAIYTCEWYENWTGGNACKLYGNGSAYQGKTANQACCFCQAQQQKPTPVAAPTAPQCTDVPDWRDSYGAIYTCQWYEDFPDGTACEKWGNESAYNGKTANQACCFCKAKL